MFTRATFRNSGHFRARIFCSVPSLAFYYISRHWSLIYIIITIVTVDVYAMPTTLGHVSLRSSPSADMPCLGWRHYCGLLRFLTLGIFYHRADKPAFLLIIIGSLAAVPFRSMDDVEYDVFMNTADFD